ncbi:MULTISPECIES: STAS domain-containing protein [Alteribacter]|uniref:GAF domain-containing protein n=1 Tax=Alteribacter keqinensis TaxID=2483800 RepID=A0A3M7TWM6_9BACI|nr:MULTISPECIES: STAS domain-containing protein [Alteribacter]MBM7097876.1 STAS domain-containing protein [Alteribacter salitolerans]RNA70060.1 GAF domain-containing protein [Alteribacter keqinensis]
MVTSFNVQSSEFPSLKSASYPILKAIGDHLNVDTAYVTNKGPTAIKVLRSFNKEEEIIPEGYEVEYGGTYCRLIITSEESQLTTPNLMKHEITSKLEVTGQLKLKGFLGVSLKNSEGEIFGTLCVMNKEETNFTDDDARYLNSMAEVLTYLIELDDVKNSMSYLTVPIVPLTKGVSVLPLQGILDDRRSARLMEAVLNHCVENKVGFFIVDVTGLIIVDSHFPVSLGKLLDALRVMGVKTLLTGVSGEMAREEVTNSRSLFGSTKTYSTMESALQSIGFHLVQNEQ